MARYVFAVIALCAIAATATALPEAPLYPNNIVFASGPLVRQPAAPQSRYVTRPVTNGAYSAPNPLFFAAQPSQAPAGQLQQPQVLQLVSEAPAAPQNFVTFSRTPAQQVIQVPTQQVQSAPSNFVTFSRTPAQQFVQVPAEPAQPNFVTFARTPAQQVVAEPAQAHSPPRNFVTFSRTPAQQFVQAPADPAQSAPRVFIKFTRNPQQAQLQQQQDLGAQTVFVRAQPNEQFGQRNVVVPAEEAVPQPQQPGTRTVILFRDQQAGSQAGSQADQSPKTVNRPRTVLVARPAEQPQPSGKIQQPSSSQFFTRSFGDAGAITYFVHPLSAPAGQAAPAPDTET